MHRIRSVNCHAGTTSSCAVPPTSRDILQKLYGTSWTRGDWQALEGFTCGVSVHRSQRRHDCWSLNWAPDSVHIERINLCIGRAWTFQPDVELLDIIWSV